MEGMDDVEGRPSLEADMLATAGCMLPSAAKSAHRHWTAGTKAVQDGRHGQAERCWRRQRES
jgi:hypothetical protein